MNKADILIRYRWLIEEAESLIVQADKAFGISKDITINDPEADVIKGLERYLEGLREKAAAILSICNQFEAVLDLLADEERVICRKYYAIGMTDREIADQLHMDQSSICRIRRKALARLEEPAEDIRISS